MSIATLSSGVSNARPKPGPKFLINYSAKIGSSLDAYDIAVLEADVAADVLMRRPAGSLTLGYLSLNEVHSGRSYFPAVNDDDVVLQANEAWPEARLVDVRAEKWRNRVLQSLVPAILTRGFNGLFIDTLDDAEYLERKDPWRFAGTTEAAASLLTALRRQFPNITIMVNRGYAVLPLATGSFDMVLGESVYTTYVAPNAYRLMTEAEYAWQVNHMRDAVRRHPEVRLFTLDYWNPEDKSGIAEIYRVQRCAGFIPYVATPDLTRIVPEP
jgi:uncharacterized protein (TIGR01370 family)